MSEALGSWGIVWQTIAGTSANGNAFIGRGFVDTIFIFGALSLEAKSSTTRGRHTSQIIGTLGVICGVADMKTDAGSFGIELLAA